MPTTLNFNLRTHMHHFREAGDGKELRLPVLLQLVLFANARNRCWPSQKTIGSNLGCDHSMVSKAIKWLREHGAIYVVPYEYRVDAEADLEPSKHVYQLTGLVLLGGEPVPYLYMADEALQQSLSELRNIGGASVIALLFGHCAESTQSDCAVLAQDPCVDTAHDPCADSAHKVF